MGQAVSPYFGDARLQAIQKARDHEVAVLGDVPGAVVHARVFSSDDPEAFGWSRLKEIMDREGVLTLRGVDKEMIERGRRELAGFSPNLHFWDVFTADAETIRTVCRPIADQELPAGVERVADAALSPGMVRDVQQFLADQGVSPFSADALLGRLFPARLVVLARGNGRIAAAGFSAMTHNRFSPFRDFAWVGLIGVDPDLRGLGLGKQVDAICNLAAVEDLGAAATMEFVAQDNAPSRAMLRSCGLEQLEGRFVVMFSDTAERLTR